jgi:hypothetical protein
LSESLWYCVNFLEMPLWFDCFLPDACTFGLGSFTNFQHPKSHEFKQMDRLKIDYYVFG